MHLFTIAPAADGRAAWGAMHGRAAGRVIAAWTSRRAGRLATMGTAADSGAFTGKGQDMSQHHQDNIQRFNRIAPQWDSDPAHVLMGQKIGRAIRQALQPQGSEEALEFGAGTGLATLIMAPKVGRLTAMDGSAGMLQVLRAKCDRKGLDNVQVVEANISEAKLGQYDLIYSALTLHHVQDVPALLQRLAAHLRPGGRIALADLDREDGSFHGPDVQGVAHQGFDRDVLAGWLADADLADVTFSTAWTVERRTDDGHATRYPVFLAVARKADG